MTPKRGMNCTPFRLTTPGSRTVTFSPDGTLFASAGGDGVAKIWDLAASLASGEGQEELALTVDENAVWLVEFSPDGKLLATASGDDVVRLWDTSSGQVLWQTNSDMYDVAFSPTGPGWSPAVAWVSWLCMTHRAVSCCRVSWPTRAISIRSCSVPTAARWLRAASIAASKSGPFQMIS